MTSKRGLTRRNLLASAAGLGVGVAVDEALRGSPRLRATHATDPEQRVSFYGTHQAGIDTPAQDFLYFGSFDVTSEARSDLEQLLRQWTVSAAALTDGSTVPGKQALNEPPI